MLVDVGGMPRSGKGAGIHYHMVLDRKVEYKARDVQRQLIAWVRMTRPDGSTIEYEDEIVPLSEEERATLPVRAMDCLDCHNRPAHQFKAPTDAVNELLADGVLSRDLPYIKREAVIALDGDYETTAEVILGIEASLRSFLCRDRSICRLDRSICRHDRSFSCRFRLSERCRSLNIEDRLRPSTVGFSLCL